MANSRRIVTSRKGANTTCPLCELERRPMEPYTAVETDRGVSCIGCGRSSVQVPHQFRARVFSDSFPQEKRNRLAELLARGASFEEALSQVDPS